MRQVPTGCQTPKSLPHESFERAVVGKRGLEGRTIEQREPDQELPEPNGYVGHRPEDGRDDAVGRAIPTQPLDARGIRGREEVAGFRIKRGVDDEARKQAHGRNHPFEITRIGQQVEIDNGIGLGIGRCQLQ